MFLTRLESAFYLAVVYYGAYENASALKISTFFCLTLFLFPLLHARLSAQQYDQERVATLAAALELEEILSPQGATELARKARSTGLWLPYPYHLYQDSPFTSNSRSGLLNYLAVQFKSAYYYRKGLDVYMDFSVEGKGANGTIDSAEYAILQHKVDKRLLTRPGTQTEVKLQQQPVVMDSSRLADGWVGFSSFNPLTDEAVPVERSVFGHDLLTTLASLNDLGVIERDTLEKYRQRLLREGLVPDYLLLKNLATHYAIIETTTERARRRGKALDYLKDAGMITGGVYRQLRKDSTFLRGIKQYDFHRILRSGQLLVVHREDGVNGLLVALEEALCRRDPLLCGLTHEVTLDTTRGMFNARLSYPGTRSDSTVVLGPLQDLKRELHLLTASAVGRMLALPNARLQAADASFRLYVSMDPDRYKEPDPDSVEVLLHAFDSQTARSMTGQELFAVTFRPFGPDPDSYLSRGEVELLTDTFTRMGVFDVLDGPDRKRGMDCLESNTVAGLSAYLRCFPRLYLPASPETLQRVRDRTSVLDQLPGQSYFHDSFRPGESMLIRLPERAALYVEEHFPMWLRRLR